jgi:ubiquinone/menaquinone biosynthesis C-methylase UbiE
VGRPETVISTYDAAAPTFECRRAVPSHVPRAIRAAVLNAVPTQSPVILDLGAGSGRTGWPFVDAGDNYVGVDLSAGMLRAFAARESDGDHAHARLVQVDGRCLPFAAGAFDVIMLMQVLGGLRQWRELLEETRRVLRPSGALVLGRVMPPGEGLDETMKRHLGAILSEMGISNEHPHAREKTEAYLAEEASDKQRIIPARWQTVRSPRTFLDRHRTGARFSGLPVAVKEDSLGRLAVWAAQKFGSLDAKISEQDQFELLIYKF